MNLPFAATSALLLATGSTFAQVSPALDRISLSAGAYQAHPTLNGRLATSEGSADTGDIGRSKVLMPRVKADVLLFDSQGFSADYYRLSRRYTSGASLPLDAGRALTGTQLDGRVEFGKLAYKWWLGSGDTVFGIGVGAGYYKLSADGIASFNVDGAGKVSRAGASIDAVAPLLDLGLLHAITPNLRLFAEASGVRKGWGRTRGSIYNASVGAEFFPLTNVGLVVSYDVSRVSVWREDALRTDLGMKIHGPSAFVKLRF